MAAGVQVGTLETTCTAALTGTVRNNAGRLEVCQSSTWSEIRTIIPAARTCRTIKTANTGASSGDYTLSAAGQAFAATCDMSTLGGGWTLIQSHNAGEATIEGAPALTGSARYLPGALVQSLALSSTEVMIRNRATPADLIVSADASPITQLRSLRILTDDANAGTAARHWTTQGTMTPANQNDGCSSQGNGAVYPGISWACDNGTGLHLLSDLNAGAALHGFRNNSQSLDVYVR